MIAFLGMGHLGANFVRALLKKGNDVQVWNRSADKAQALESEGARPFANVADAVKGANRIHITLSDDASVDETLEAAKSGFEGGVIIIDHTTTSVEGAVKRTQYWKEQGFTYVHAPVFMGPPNALDSTGFMLISGDQDLAQQLTAELSTMTGTLMNLGEETGKAAGMKLIGNLFLMSITAGLSDALGLAKSLNFAPTDVAMLFDAWNPGGSVKARLQKMTSNTFNKPSWELNMARKDARLMLEEAKRGNGKLIVIPAVAKEMDEWIEKGHGKDDWTVIGKNNI